MSASATQSIPTLQRSDLRRLGTAELPRLLDSVLDPADRVAPDQVHKTQPRWAWLLGKQLPKS